MSEEAMQVDIQYMREMNVYVPCEHETVKDQGLTPIRTRWMLTKMVDTERPFIRARLAGDEEDDKDRPDGHIHDFRGDSTC